MNLDHGMLLQTHVTCVVLSGAGFGLRGIWMLAAPAMLARPWVRIAPHVVDTVLLVSAVGLAILTRQYPFVHGWLTAKVLALVVYVGLGIVALRRGRTRGTRSAAFAGALLVYLYIVSVALTRSPLPFAG